MQLRMVYGQRPDEATLKNPLLYDLIRYTDNIFVGDLKD